MQQKEIFNGRILALFFFQYSLLIPLMSRINATLLVGGSSFALACILIAKNGKLRVDASILIFMLVGVLVLCLKVLLDGTSMEVLLYFVLMAGPAAIMNLYRYDLQEFLKFGAKLAWINFALIFWVPFGSNYAYMRFGFGMLTTVTFLYIKVVHGSSKKTNHLHEKATRVVDLLFFCAGMLEMILFGNRGAVFAFLLFGVLDTFLVQKKHLWRNGIIIATSTVVTINIIPLLNFLNRIAARVGIGSHNITQFRNQIIGGFASASSGRAGLYETAFKDILAKPIIGNPIYITDENGYYVHNLFLQVAKDLGLIWFILLIVFLVGSLVIMVSKKSENNVKIVLALLFGTAVGRLMFNSSFWLRPEFWLLLFFQIHNGSSNNIRRRVRLPNKKSSRTSSDL